MNFFYIIFLYFLSFINDKMITFSLQYLSAFPCVFTEEVGMINFNLISPFNCFMIDLLSQSKRNFTIINNITKILLDEEITLQYYQDTINFTSTNTVVPVNFYGFDNYLKNHPTPKHDEILRLYSRKLSFAFNPPDKSLSFIHELFSKGIINKIIFGFDFKSRYIYIGDIPSNMTNHLSHQSCSVIDDVWGCYIKSIKLKDYNKNVYSFSNKIRRAVFSFSHEFISVPKDEFENLVNTVFREELRSEQCKIKNDPYFSHEVFLFCQELSSNIPELFNIQFDTFTITYITERLFIKKNGCYQFLIGYIENSLNYEVDIGYLALQSFNLLFDYDEKAIKFYLRNDYMFHGFSFIHNEIKIKLFVIITFILLIWIFLIMVWLIKKNALF